MQVDKDVLLAELKLLRGGLHKAALDATERQQRAAKLRAKHDTLSSKRVGADGFQEPKSQACMKPMHATSTRLHSLRMTPGSAMPFYPYRLCRCPLPKH